mmetsp:Transcript_68604/g.221659  ORF Transcript_68604/g.221659 Transcript_68604/m.221659 type:complete len:201 (+) Transcript_68604:276-878(+)
MPSFRGGGCRGGRNAYLDLCWHLDRAVFFLAVLRPYHRLAGMAGDMAMCWLRDSLGHLLQELERALLQLRQSRLEVMRAAKLHLQDVAKRPPKAGTEPFRWMQGLRHVDEVQLDGLHQAAVALCTDARVATTVAREAELSASARRGLRDMAAAFASADFQARCAPALRDRLAADLNELAGAAAAAEGSGEPRMRALPAPS